MATWVDFDEGKHPKSLKVIPPHGKPMCKNVMKWYAKMVFLVEVTKANFLV
jgi:hypothetical protein